MDRIWQWAWDRHGRRYSWAVCAVVASVGLPIYVFWSFLIVAVEQSNVSYFAYGAWFWVIKVSHAATSVACRWPYPEAKVCDPQGYYEKAGAQGP